jgi:DNA-binding SARP family transcriptional activator
MRLSVLGPLIAVADDSTPIPLGGPQQHRLLCALAVQCPSPVSKDTLQDLLWPSGAPSANALQAQVSKLRRSIAPLEVIGTSSGYALNIERCLLDADRFEQLVTIGRDSAAAGDTDRAAANFSEALAMWRGGPHTRRQPITSSPKPRPPV